MAFREQDIPYFTTVFGRGLLAEVPNFTLPKILIVTMDDLWPVFRNQLPGDVKVYCVRSMERTALDSDLQQVSGAASIVGLGGGQAIDAAKYFAWRLGKPLCQFPTALSVDAVFGHRSAIRSDGIVNYVGWAVPQSVYIDLDIIESAPRLLNVAGAGDIFCFFTGVMDWAYACSKGKCESRWPYSDELAQISLSKAEVALANVNAIRDLTPAGIRIMVDALRWGGASYHGAGWNPRHIEGVEHYIFYALEAQTRKPFLHGQAVCLGLIFGAMMHGKMVGELLDAVACLGIDIRPEALGISWEDVHLAMRSLRDFVVRENLPFGIAHDFRVSKVFFETAQNMIEEVYRT